MSVIKKLWERFWGKPGGAAPAAGGETYVVARCIGCGQCAAGCPVAVKIKKK